MSPATVGLQYQRDASRGQVVLLPATAAALGVLQHISHNNYNFCFASFIYVPTLIQTI